MRSSSVAAWGGGLIVALALCCGYPSMFALRRVWQSHYPTLAGQWANNGRFAVLGYFGTETGWEELGYAARVNDASRHFMAYDPFVRESRSRRQFLVDKASYSALALLKLLVGEINWTWIAGRFLCCWAWFVLIFILSLEASESPAVAAFCATFITGFSYVLTFLFVHALEWGKPLQSAVHGFWAVLSYGRTEGVLRLHRPGFTYVFLFLGCLWLLKTARSRSWNWALLSGLLGGALAYVHLDSWTAYMSAAGFFCLLHWPRREAFWRLALSVGISSLLSIPFLLANYPANQELVLRGVLTSQLKPTLDPFSLVYLAVALAVLKFKRGPADLLLASLCLGGAVMTNIGFLLGYSFEPPKWEYITNIFVLILAASWLPRRWKTASRPWYLASGLLTAVMFLQSFFYAAIHFPFQGIPKDYDDALRWLDLHTPADSEVMTLNAEVNVLIPTYTHDFVLLAVGPPIMSDYPLAKTYARLLGGLRLLGADAGRFTKDCVLVPDPYDRRSTLDSASYRDHIEKAVLGKMIFFITPEPKVRDIMAQARPAEIHPDYLWFGRIEKDYARPGFPSRDRDWKEVYRNPSVTLYQRLLTAHTSSESRVSK